MRRRQGARVGGGAWRWLPLLLACLASACANPETPVTLSPLTASAVPVASPPLPEAPIPTPGARVRVVNVGRHEIHGLSLVFPKEQHRIGTLALNATSTYVTTVNGAYEGPIFQFSVSDVVLGPHRPELSEQAPPAPIGGHAFTFYVQLEVDEGPGFAELPWVRLARITREE